MRQAPLPLKDVRICRRKNSGDRYADKTTHTKLKTSRRDHQYNLRSINYHRPQLGAREPIFPAFKTGSLRGENTSGPARVDHMITPRPASSSVEKNVQAPAKRYPARAEADAVVGTYNRTQASSELSHLSQVFKG
jgi:hypothetical protein